MRVCLTLTREQFPFIDRLKYLESRVAFLWYCLHIALNTSKVPLAKIVTLT